MGGAGSLSRAGEGADVGALEASGLLVLSGSIVDSLRVAGAEEEGNEARLPPRAGRDVETSASRVVSTGATCSKQRSSRWMMR